MSSQWKGVLHGHLLNCISIHIFCFQNKYANPVQSMSCRTGRYRVDPLDFMMASWNGNIFRVAGHLCGEFTGDRWISRTKASDEELFTNSIFKFICLHQNDFTFIQISLKSIHQRPVNYKPTSVQIIAWQTIICTYDGLVADAYVCVTEICPNITMTSPWAQWRLKSPASSLFTQRKHQSSASLAFVRGIHWGPVNFPHKWPVTRKMFPFDDVIMERCGKDDIVWNFTLYYHTAR